MSKTYFSEDAYCVPSSVEAVGMTYLNASMVREIKECHQQQHIDIDQCWTHQECFRYAQCLLICPCLVPHHYFLVTQILQSRREPTIPIDHLFWMRPLFLKHVNHMHAFIIVVLFREPYCRRLRHGRGGFGRS